MILIFILLFTQSLNADQRTEAFFTTRYRKFSSSPLTQENQDNFLYFKHELTDTAGSVHWQVSPYLLFSNSQRVDQGGDPIVTPLFSSVRQMNIETHFDSNPSTRGIIDFQELAIEYSKYDFKIEMGRRILSIGNLKLFSVWNKFNPTAISFRPTWLTGIDQLKLSWQSDNNKIVGYSVFDQQESDRAQFVIYDHFASPFQFSFLVGQWWQSTSIGFSGNVDADGWLLKIEALSFSYFNLQSGRPNEIQTAMGVEHGFAQDWVVNLELFSQSQGATSRDGYVLFNKSPHQSFKGRYLGATEIKWSPDPFYSFSGLIAVSFIDQSSVLGLTCTRQINDNLELSLGVMLPQGDGELGSKFQLLSPTNSIGVPAQADLTLKTYF